MWGGWELGCYDVSVRRGSGDPSTDVPGVWQNRGDSILWHTVPRLVRPAPRVRQSIYTSLDTFRSRRMDHTVLHKWLIKQTTITTQTESYWYLCLTQRFRIPIHFLKDSILLFELVGSNLRPTTPGSLSAHLTKCLCVTPPLSPCQTKENPPPPGVSVSTRGFWQSGGGVEENPFRGVLRVWRVPGVE